MSRTSAQITAAIGCVNTDARVAHSRARLIREEIVKTENAVLASLVRHQGSGHPDQMSIGEFIGNPVVQRLAELRVLLDLIEASPEHDLAVRELEPLHGELAAALASEHEAALAVAAAANALADAETAAREKLEAKIAADPAVAKARAALAGVKRLGEPLEELASDAEDLRADFK